ncbi:cobalt-zinc-cadmium efflux system membrane fusion protein [Balneicella halophila]|uniref:Cobalt-zinc-cadmium efflux system membrane fusion protein n=1 Tax=Balneicella halophila TaxID=1537566 RepID=A0A7L4UQM3_BALHA|nr:efflux RND transporter periplasmic adaptor subunit [Balneicella halophila]PVX52078.1 cobalt-zinc-cadmium efflux system membrane fusion protein [Balneicella halophila]
MRNKIYITFTILALSLQLTSCSTKDSKATNNGAIHKGEDQNQTPEMNNLEEHVHEEVHLSQQQFVALKMKIDTLKMRNMGGYVKANGMLSVPPQSKATVTSLVEANVVHIQVTEGDEVRKGQVLAYLSHPNIVKTQTDYLNAYTNNVFLEKNYQRQKRLYDAGVGSGANFQKAESEYETSKAALSGLEAQLKLLNVDINATKKGNIVQKIALRAPINGFVQKVDVNIGQYVSAQTEMFQIVNTKHIHADLMVFEKDAFKIKRGQKVSFEDVAIDGEELVGEIHSVGKSFETNPKAIRVHVDVENKKNNLIPGVYVKGKIRVENDLLLAIPQSAVIKEDDKFYIFSVEKEEEEWAFKPVEIVVGANDGEWVEIELLDDEHANDMFAFNNAYYLIAEMKKSEAGHSH